MKFLFVQPIFVPSEIMFRKNYNSVMSMIEYFNTYRYSNIEFLFGGWNFKETYFEQMKIVLRNFYIKEYDKNYGKAYIINDLISNYDKDYDYIFTLDSDIILDINCPNMFSRFESFIEILNKKRNKPLGILALKQNIFNCHLDNIYDNTFTIQQEIFHYPNEISGIAGGVFFTSKEIWKLNNGYKIFGSFGGDDGHYLLDCVKNNFSVQVCSSIWITHPYEDDIEYLKWKVNKCRGTTLITDYWKELSNNPK